MRYATVTNPPTERSMEKSNEQTKDPADFKRGAGTVALALIGLGTALAVRGGSGRPERTIPRHDRKTRPQEPKD